MPNRNFFYFYALSILLVMCASYSLMFTWSIPRVFIIVLSVFAPLLYLCKIKCDTRLSNILLCALWGIVVYYMMFARGISGSVAFFRRLGEVLCVVSIILLPIGQKKELLRFVTIGVSAIVAFSLPAWILHLIGVPLPHTSPFLLEDGYHWVTNYYFFLAGDEYNVLKFPRFRGMFVEGGQVAPVCVFLYFANNRQLPIWQKICLFSAIILSFSLAGYITFVICYVLHSLLNPQNKYRILKTFLFLSVIMGMFVFFNNPQNQNNPLYSLIIKRLEADDEKVIVGYNRTSEYVDYRYQQIMKSDDRYIGVGKELREDNWSNDSSGIKKFVIWNGLIGASLVALFMLILLLNHRSYMSFVMWFCAIMNFLVRDLLTNPMWMNIVILGVFMLHKDYLDKITLKT